MPNADGSKSGGRKKGTPNKATADVMALAQRHGPAAIAKLAQIAKDDKHTGQVAAIKELLDRAYGKPTQSHTADFNGKIEVTWINGG